MKIINFLFVSASFVLFILFFVYVYAHGFDSGIDKIWFALLICLILSMVTIPKFYK